MFSNCNFEFFIKLLYVIPLSKYFNIQTINGRLNLKLFNRVNYITPKRDSLFELIPINCSQAPADSICL